MSNPFLDAEYSDQDRAARELRSAFAARLEVAELHSEKLVEEFRFSCAKALLSAGITLIPSENLEDHQFVVSRGVYEAAKKSLDSL